MCIQRRVKQFIEPLNHISIKTKTLENYNLQATIDNKANRTQYCLTQWQCWQAGTSSSSNISSATSLPQFHAWKFANASPPAHRELNLLSTNIAREQRLEIVDKKRKSHTN